MEIPLYFNQEDSDNTPQSTMQSISSPDIHRDTSSSEKYVEENIPCFLTPLKSVSSIDLTTVDVKNSNMYQSMY